MNSAYRIHKDGRGEWQAHAQEMYFGRCANLDAAIERVRAGHTVFVAAEHVAAVLDAAKGAAERGEPA